MTLFDEEIKRLLQIEGGYSNNPADSGGATRYGITEAVARRRGYTGAMDALPLGVAIEIYRAEYWNALSLDPVAALSRAIASELFDTGVNCGVGFAARCLQRSLNVLNLRQAYYADLRIDGDLGARTVEALGAFLAKRGADGEKALLRALNALQGSFYIELAERREKDEDFMFGWFLKRVS